MIELIFNIAFSIALIGGSSSLGKLFIRIGWPKVKTLEED